MHREEIDGVRIVYRDVPGEYHGTLVFGVVVDAVSTEADFGSACSTR
jgi:hypothetical protein